MKQHGHARRLVDGLDDAVRRTIRDDPLQAAQEVFALTAQPSSSFRRRGAGGWCDGTSITQDRILLYRPTESRRHNFTIAHELGHHLIADDDDCPSWLADQGDPDRLEEEICDLIAARLLIPDSDIDAALAGSPPEAETVARLYAATRASRTACAIAVANKLPCEGFGALIEPGSSEIFAGARARDTRPYAWKGNPIPPAHPLRRENLPARSKAWWPDPSGKRRTFYMTVADVAGFTCALFAENDLWQVETLHVNLPAEPDRGNDASITCPCGYKGKTRMFPCRECGASECPQCGECDCARRARREKRAMCNGCMTSVRAHLLVDGLCDNCR